MGSDQTAVGLAATYQEAYRDFDHQITGLSAQFKF